MIDRDLRWARRRAVRTGDALMNAKPRVEGEETA